MSSKEQGWILPVLVALLAVSFTGRAQYSPPSGGGSATPPGSVLVEEHTASSSASLAFTTCFTSAYDNYEIQIVQLVPGTTGQAMLLQVSVDGGTTYDGGSNYAWSGFRFSSGGSATAGSDTGTSVDLGAGDVVVSGLANGGFSGHLYADNPLGAATANPGFHGQSGYNGGNPGFTQLTSIWSARYLGTTAVNAFRLKFAAGNVASGTVRCYGKAK